MLGFELTIWDYLTFLVIFVLVGAFLAIAVFVLGLPGRIALPASIPMRTGEHDGLARVHGCRATFLVSLFGNEET